MWLAQELGLHTPQESFKHPRILKLSELALYLKSVEQEGQTFDTGIMQVKEIKG